MCLLCEERFYRSPRSGRRKVRKSSASKAGSSTAAKCPPRGISIQRRTLKKRSAQALRGGPAKAEAPGTTTQQGRGVASPLLGRPWWRHIVGYVVLDCPGVGQASEQCESRLSGTETLSRYKVFIATSP